MSAPAEYDATAEYQRRCLDIAREIATLPIDGERKGEDGPAPGNSIDAQTREAARAFLRSEFARWTDGEGDDEYDEDEPTDPNGQHEPAQ